MKREIEFDKQFHGGSGFDTQDGYPGYEYHLSVMQAAQSSEWDEGEFETDPDGDDSPIAKLIFEVNDGDDMEKRTLLTLEEIDRLITMLNNFKAFCAEHSVPRGKLRPCDNCGHRPEFHADGTGRCSGRIIDNNPDGSGPRRDRGGCKCRAFEPWAQLGSAWIAT